MFDTAIAIRNSFGQAFVNSGRSIAAHATNAGAVTRISAKNAAAKVPATAVAAGKSFGTGVVINIVALEAADYLVGKYVDRKRRQEIHYLVGKIAADGATDLDREQLELLSRVPERRTFGQFVRDIPSRAVRRIYRATLVEAGWWYGLITMPIWLPTVAVFTAYTWLFALPVSVASEAFFNRPIDIDPLMAMPSRVTKTVLKYTLMTGVRWFMKGCEMRLHDNSVYTSPEAFDTLSGARFKAHEVVKTMVDGRTAFVWGEALAEAVAEIPDVPVKQAAFAQFFSWAEVNVAPEFLHAATQGFRTGTPLLYRDYVPA